MKTIIEHKNADSDGEAATAPELFSEEWKDLQDGFQISNYGRVRNKRRRIMRPLTERKDGHKNAYVTITHNYKRKRIGVAYETVKHFVDGVGGNFKVYHIDGDYLNNRLDNLKIVDKFRARTKEQIEAYNKGVYWCIWYWIGRYGMGGERKHGVDIDSLIQETALSVWVYLPTWDGKHFCAFVGKHFRYNRVLLYKEYLTRRNHEIVLPDEHDRREEWDMRE